jgi:hypothetical protein
MRRQLTTVTRPLLLSSLTQPRSSCVRYPFINHHWQHQQVVAITSPTRISFSTTTSTKDNTPFYFTVLHHMKHDVNRRKQREKEEKEEKEQKEQKSRKENKKENKEDWRTIALSASITFGTFLFIRDNHNFKEKLFHTGNSSEDVKELLYNHFRWHWLTIKGQSLLPRSFDPLTTDDLKHKETWQNLEHLAVAHFRSITLLNAIVDRSSELWSTLAAVEKISQSTKNIVDVNWRAINTAIEISNAEMVEILMKGYKNQYIEYIYDTVSSVHHNNTDNQDNTKTLQEGYCDMVWDRLIALPDNWDRTIQFRRVFMNVFVSGEVFTVNNGKDKLPSDILYRYFVAETYHAARRGDQCGERDDTCEYSYCLKLKTMNTVKWWFQCKSIPEKLKQKIETNVMSMALTDQRTNHTLNLQGLQELLGLFYLDEKKKTVNDVKRSNVLKVLPKQYLIEAAQLGRIDILRELHYQYLLLHPECLVYPLLTANENVEYQENQARIDEEQLKVATLSKQVIFETAVNAKQTAIVDWMMETDNVFGTPNPASWSIVIDNYPQVD